MMTFDRFLRICQYLQGRYIRHERRRMDHAALLDIDDRAGFKALGLHPHSAGEIVARMEQLDEMSRTIETTHADGPVIRHAFRRYVERRASSVQVAH